MKPHTDSQIVEHHEDGSWTTTTVVTDRPATTAEKAAAWGVVGGMTLLSVSPILILAFNDWRETRRERKLAEAKSETTD